LTADDAVADALARGALDRAIAETLAMAAAEDEVEIDDEALQKSSERYRYEHDLISAGETEEWLGARGMTLDDFAQWLNARLCVAGRRAEARRSTEPEDFSERLLIHLWLSGEMDRIVEEFRRRIAAQIELAGESLSPDAAHERVVRNVLTEDARRHTLEILRLPLTRLEIESLELESDAAAREAMLCVHNDGESLAEVAADAAYPTRREVLWSEDAGRTLVPQAPFAKDGELLGPIRAGDRFKLCQVIRRIEPSLGDREVAARVDSMLLDEYFTDLCARHTQLPVIARTTQ